MPLDVVLIRLFEIHGGSNDIEGGPGANFICCLYLNRGKVVGTVKGEIQKFELPHTVDLVFTIAT